MSFYYSMESVREQIIGKYEVRSSKIDTVSLPSWNRYPCPIIEECKRKKQISCIGYVSIFVNTPTIIGLELPRTAPSGSEVRCAGRAPPAVRGGPEGPNRT